jgi:predicted regulator of Ras-like GTPase activity (Roadblock/LC7/MglB family)
LAVSKAKQMVEELKKLQISSPDIQASAVVSVDGLIIASALPATVIAGGKDISGAAQR